MATSVNLGIGVFLSVLALLAAALSFSTDHWASWLVRRDKLRDAAANDPTLDINKQPEYFSRNWGLFRMCFPGNDTIFLDTYQKPVIDGNCLNVEYELTDPSVTDYDRSSRTSDYWTRIHVLRCQFGFLAVGMLLLVFSFVCGTWACWSTSHSGALTSGMCCLFGAIFIGGSLGCFHAMHYLEQSRIKDTGFYLQWPLVLRSNSTWTLRWSYFLCWAAVGLAVLACIFFFVESYIIKSKKKMAERKKRLAMEGMHNPTLTLERYIADAEKRSMAQGSVIAPEDIHFQSLARPGSRRSYHDSDDQRLVPVLVYDYPEATQRF